LAQQLEANETTIINELNAAQGPSVDIGGYYLPDLEKITAAMRPSATLNAILDKA
jgi:isocitrate dehydrogenase